MVTIAFPPSDVAAVQAEIARISARITGLDNDIQFFNEQLNGKPAEYLFSAEEIEQNPFLEEEQQILFPATIGAIARDLPYYNMLFSQVQPVINPYEAERRLLDGVYPDFTIPGPLGPGSGVFDENLLQTSGVNSVLPLFDPSVSTVALADPGQMFGGLASDTLNEVAKIDVELTAITTLLSPFCQGIPPVPFSCQTARTTLINSLKARFDPSVPSGILLSEETAVLSNPDLSQFSSNPSGAITSEKVRIQSFLAALAPIPPTAVIPSALLLSNQTAATARKTYIQSTRIPEMGGFLNTNPGYYSIRFGVSGQRVNNGGTLKEIKFLQSSITEAEAQKTDLLSQKAFLESLLPV